MSEVILDLYPAYQIDNSKYQDYVGFTYNNIHSSELGIKRTSDGSRFNENLLPSFQDKTFQIPGGDGTYYFGSYFTQRQFNVSFAFDSLDEAGVQRLKAVFGDKKIHDLIFDEAPYKVYRAKVTGTATIKYIAFDEGKSNRTYKGEGTINFTCYQPFAKSKFKTLEEYITEGYENIDEWAAASGILSASEYKNTEKNYDTYSNNTINLYNPGDLETDFKLKLSFVSQQITGSSIQIGQSKLVWKKFSSKTKNGVPDSYVKIDSKLNLIEGYDDSDKKTGNIYNEYITSGEFFKIPTGESILNTTISSEIEYDYLYF